MYYIVTDKREVPCADIGVAPTLRLYILPGLGQPATGFEEDGATWEEVAIKRRWGVDITCLLAEYAQHVVGAVYGTYLAGALGSAIVSMIRAKCSTTKP